MRKAKSRIPGATGGTLSKAAAPQPRRQAQRTERARELREVVAVVREGDGIDPREEAKRKRRASGAGRPGLERGAHRQERFAAQAQQALDSALQLAAEPLLNALTVQEIVPQGATLLVVAGPRDTSVPLDVTAATQAIQKASSMLTREVAHAITRKETPNLSYIVLPAGAERVET